MRQLTVWLTNCDCASFVFLWHAEQTKGQVAIQFACSKKPQHEISLKRNRKDANGAQNNVPLMTLQIPDLKTKVTHTGSNFTDGNTVGDNTLVWSHGHKSNHKHGCTHG